MLQTIIKIVSDTNRLRIINLIKDDSLCVGEIQTLLGTMQSNTSRHLEKLRTSGLITSAKDGQRIYYTLDKTFVDKYAFLSNLIYEDVLKDSQFKKDLERLSYYKASGLDCEDLRKINFDFNRIEPRK